MLAATLPGSAGAGLNGRSGCGSSASSGVLAVVRLAAARVDVALLPPLVASAAPAGTLSAAGAAALGLPAGLPACRRPSRPGRPTTGWRAGATGPAIRRW